MRRMLFYKYLGEEWADRMWGRRGLTDTTPHHHQHTLTPSTSHLHSPSSSHTHHHHHTASSHTIIIIIIITINSQCKLLHNIILCL